MIPDVANAHKNEFLVDQWRKQSVYKLSKRALRERPGIERVRMEYETAVVICGPFICMDVVKPRAILHDVFGGTYKDMAAVTIKYTTNESPGSDGSAIHNIWKGAVRRIPR
jgi:hypothetical protein